MDARKTITEGKAILGIEFGSTRIKAVLIDEENKPIAQGSHEWENQLVDGLWTYSTEAIWYGLQDCYAELRKDVLKQYDCEIEALAAIGFSAMMHGYMAFNEKQEILVPFRTWRNTNTGKAAAELSELFAESLGVKAEFVEIDWDNKILELNGGSVDCIWNGMTLTPEVGNAMSCTDTYALNAQVVVMATDKLDQYADAASMASLSFAAEAGSAGEEVGLDEGFNVNSVQNQAAALMEVAAGTSDACIIDKTMADAMTGEGTSYTNLGYKVSLSSEEYVVGFRKGSDLTQKLNDLFAQWKADGTLKAMSEKYDNAVSIVE